MLKRSWRVSPFNNLPVCSPSFRLDVSDQFLCLKDGNFRGARPRPGVLRPCVPPSLISHSFTGTDMIFHATSVARDLHEFITTCSQHGNSLSPSFLFSWSC